MFITYKRKKFDDNVQFYTDKTVFKNMFCNLLKKYKRNTLAISRYMLNEILL